MKPGDVGTQRQGASPRNERLIDASSIGRNAEAPDANISAASDESCPVDVERPTPQWRSPRVPWTVS
jgi:hypothetical protein